jgi:hypothetical protein
MRSTQASRRPTKGDGEAGGTCRAFMAGTVRVTGITRNTSQLLTQVQRAAQTRK